MSIRHHRMPAYLRATVIIGGLTAAEAAWALAFVTVGESQPWIWLLPLAVTAAAIWLLARTPSSDRAAAPA